MRAPTARASSIACRTACVAVSDPSVPTTVDVNISGARRDASDELDERDDDSGHDEDDDRQLRPDPGRRHDRSRYPPRSLTLIDAIAAFTCAVTDRCAESRRCFARSATRGV